MSKQQIIGVYRADHPRDGMVFDHDTCRTRQEFKDECDVNKIMKRFEMSGIIDHVAQMEPHFTDIPEMGDFQDILNNVNAVTEGFMELPARVRAAFDNDALLFVEALQDPDAQDELVELGVIAGPEPQETAELEAAAPNGAADEVPDAT